MKALLSIITLLLSTNLYAGSTIEVHETEVTVRVEGIQCVLRPFENDGVRVQYTNLGDRGGSVVLHDSAGHIELNHDRAHGEGCDLQAMDEIHSLGTFGFGFAHGIKVSVSKEIFDPRLVNGQCLSYYRETIEIDFGKGPILKNTEAENRITTGC